MSWIQILSDAGLSEREANAVIILSTSPNMKASELAKELGTTRLDAYNSLERLQQIGLVTSTADRPMRFSSPSITDVVKHLVEIRREQLSRIEEGFKRMDSGKKSRKESSDNKASIDETKFAVLKERVHILKRIEKMADEAEESLVLVLGKFGILHLCRSSALSEINSAAKKGVVVRVLGQLDKRTIRFYNELDSSIEIRHSESLDAQSAVMDSSEVIQYLKTEENPVGRGKNDVALVVHSSNFADSQSDLIEWIWEEAIPFEAASKRFTEEKIVDPLRLTLDSGSFLDKIRSVLQITDELPDTDTPFNPKAFMAAGAEISEARKELEKGGLASLSSFGIDISSLLRQVGNRIGQELSFSLRNIQGHMEFLNEMMDWWEYAGLGKLSYDIDPEFHIKVNLSSLKDEKDILPLWSLDDGIIEGALTARYLTGGNVLIRREEVEGDPDEFCRYNLIFRESKEHL